MTKTVNLSTSVPSVTFVKTGLLVLDEIDILNGRLSDLSTALGGQMSTSLTSLSVSIVVIPINNTDREKNDPYFTRA
ncbi:hypothetical protein M5U04_20790 [Xenorhabdus sp. XENO-1]|uniref:hypothetical protein n=1 Tax=Xenorhabdus bovienii TaxID=40576 RepID=UPI0020CA8CD1|nr:hypothetical protein [Xenorhabdus bovienii]MCP9270438.1 hypothetical protein [Xenorhabdus bovienii subsp. africana]